MFSLILPAYNEAERLERCVNEVKKILKGYHYEIIIAEDGSTDGTDKIAGRLAKKDKKIKFIHNEKKLGRGLALKRSMKKAEGSSIGYIDVDMATDIKHLKELVEYSKRYDVVTGSRYMPNSKIERPFLRKFASLVYNFIIRHLIGCNIYDSQCGFKMFSKKFVENEIFKIREKTWAWDTVVLVEALKKGYKVKEFSVNWREKKESAHSASIKRIYKDTKIHGLVLLKLFVRWRLGIKVQV